MVAALIAPVAPTIWNVAVFAGLVGHPDVAKFWMALKLTIPASSRDLAR